MDDKAIKVAYFAHASNLTGANRALIELIDLLKDKKILPIVFIPKHGPIESELIRLEIQYYIITFRQWIYPLKLEKNLLSRIKFYIKETINSFNAKKAARIIVKEKVQLIHSNSLLIGFGAQVADATGLPHIWHLREFLEEDHQYTFFDEKKAFDSVKKANSLIAISDVVAEKFSKKFQRDVLTIYDGVDIEKYIIPDKRILSREEHTELMIAGRIIDTKGQMDAVKAIAQLHEKFPGLHLRVIGDGTPDGTLEKMQAFIREYSLEEVIEYLPFQTDLSNYSKDCDIQLVCSYNEAFGRVTVEGMLSHSLVIGANAGCTPYLIHDGENGLLYTCKDPASLAEKIEWALGHKEEAQKIADNGYISAQEHFSAKTTAEKILKLYKNILE